MKKLLLGLFLSVIALSAHAQATYQINPGNINIATSQVTVAATATQVTTQRNGRSQLTVINLGTTAVYCAGSSAVTTANGALLPGVLGASLTIPYQGTLYCIAATGTQPVSIFETF